MTSQDPHETFNTFLRREFFCFDWQEMNFSIEDYGDYVVKNYDPWNGRDARVMSQPPNDFDKT